MPFFQCFHESESEYPILVSTLHLMSRSMPPMKGRIYVLNRLTYIMSVIAGRINFIISSSSNTGISQHGSLTFILDEFSYILIPFFVLPPWPCLTLVFFLLSCSLVVYLWPMRVKSFGKNNEWGDYPVYGKQHRCVNFCMSFIFATCSSLPLLFMRLTSFSPSFFRMMVLTSICTTCSSCHLNHALILYFRPDLVKTLKDANAKGTFFFSS